MPSRRNNVNQTAQMAAIFAQALAAFLPNMLQQINQANNNNNGQGQGGNQQCTYKHFNACNPLKFKGTEGATGLLKWFENMENTFLNADCPDNLKVVRAAGCLLDDALTWWNKEKYARGEQAAIALTWAEFREIMMQEFCPQNEIRKLEEEFWDLEQQSGENQAYNTRHRELSILIPHMVTPLYRGIEKYICGLPSQIQDTVWGSKPATLSAAMELAATLTDKHVKEGTLTRKSEKKSTITTETSKANTPTPDPPKENTNIPNKPSSQARNGTKRVLEQPDSAHIPDPISLYQVRVTNPSYKKPYQGPMPQCNTCGYHHPFHAPCRICENCGRYGHMINFCRLVQQNAQDAPVAMNGRACFECGDPNHLRNTCPQRVNRGGNHRNNRNQWGGSRRKQRRLSSKKGQKVSFQYRRDSSPGRTFRGSLSCISNNLYCNSEISVLPIRFEIYFKFNILCV